MIDIKRIIEQREEVDKGLSKRKKKEDMHIDE